MRRRATLLLFCLVATLVDSRPAPAEEIRVAVAANFEPTARALADAFEARSGHRVVLSSASSGSLYAQIRNGAPFDLFLSADADRPRRLTREGAAAGKARLYAIGRLVWWAPRQRGDAARCRRRLLRAKRLAMANPQTAPYGLAAAQTLKKLAINPAYLKIVTGENIGQTYAYVASGAVEGGFVAASQLVRSHESRGCRWPVPASLHPPLEQGAVLLRRGGGKPAARAFFRYLFSAEARQLIRDSGYELPP